LKRAKSLFTRSNARLLKVEAAEKEEQYDAFELD
jgi:hypothetical protein